MVQGPTRFRIPLEHLWSLEHHLFLHKLRLRTDLFSVMDLIWINDCRHCTINTDQHNSIASFKSSFQQKAQKWTLANNFRKIGKETQGKMGFGLQIGFIAQSFVALVELCDDDDPGAATFISTEGSIFCSSYRERLSPAASCSSCGTLRLKISIIKNSMGDPLTLCPAFL